MIVVIGSAVYRPGSPSEPDGVAGLAAGIAASAAAEDRDVQLVGRVGEDAAGDALLLALARARIGHVATLRDAAHPTPVIPVPRDDLTGPGGWSADAAEAEPVGSLGPAGSATLDRGDLELALRYLDGFAVLVVAEPLDPSALVVAVEGAAYAGAWLVLLVHEGDRPPDGAEAVVLTAPASDPDGVFARTVGRFVAALDAGREPAAALAAATAADGWERIGPGD